MEFLRKIHETMKSFLLSVISFTFHHLKQNGWKSMEFHPNTIFALQFHRK